VLPFIGVDAETFYATNYLCMISPWMVNGTLANYVTSDLYVPEKDCNRLVSSFERIHHLAGSFSP
jgi:hypothetical protein